MSEPPGEVRSTNDDDNPDTPGVGVFSGQVIVDGLLCCVARAISRKANMNELSEAVMREFEKGEIANSWTVLFTHFSNAWCKERNKPVIQVARTETRLMVKDIMDHLVMLDTAGEQLQILCMPWNYIINNLETDSEVRAQHMVTESASHVDSKIEAMEQRMIAKNQEMFISLKAMIENISAPRQQGATYAGVAAQDQQAGHHVWGPQVGARGAGPGVQVRVTPAAGYSSRGRDGSLQVSAGQGRGRSPSIKRVRLDNGDTLEVVQDRSNNKSTNNPKKAVTGTSNANITGRKMRSPPADIFVYGVHPDTTEEDIVTDLADSGIVIHSKDVLKKSKEEAPLKSFKISVKAEDLQKALDPSVWPLRVKVREYIYYSKRALGRQDAQHADAPQQHGGQGHQQGAPGGVSGSDSQWQGVPTKNKFAVLGTKPSASPEPSL